MGLDLNTVIEELGLDDEEKIRKFAMSAIIAMMSPETASILKEIISLPIRETEKEKMVLVFLSAYSCGRKDAEMIQNPNRELTNDDIDRLKEFVAEHNIN